MGKIFINDIGTEILLDTSVNLTTASVTDIKYLKPNGSTGIWNASIQDDTKLKYIAIASDFDTVGEYRLQASVWLPSWRGHGNTAKLVVHALNT